MANNLFISYDLYNPGQNYDAVAKAIKSLGGWAKVHKSYSYVKTNFDAPKVRDIVWAAMDGNDSLFVVDATNNFCAWQNISEEVAQHIRDCWNQAAAA